jgi:hypothetical protein
MHQLTYKPRPSFDLELHFLALLGTIVYNKTPDDLINRLGLREAPGFGVKRRDPAIEAEVIRLRELGVSYREIRDKTGVSETVANGICKSVGLVQGGRKN